MKLCRVVILLGVLLLVAAPALAGDTGTLVVKTTFKDGAPAVGAVVQVENTKNLAALQAKRTDDQGSATFVLPAGPGYVITVTLAGFGTVSEPDITVEINKKKQLTFKMLEQLTEKITVRGAKVVDLDEGGETKVTFSETFMEDLPVFGRSYQNVLTLAPGVQDSNNDGNPNVHGARERDFKATVDGVSNVDPLTGTFMSNVNPDAIEEIEVVTTGQSAEYGRAMGGAAKIITKQGGNTFDGVAGLFLRSSFLDRGGALSKKEGGDLNYHDVRPSISFTGPVIKDKLFFALFHQYEDRGSPVNLLSGGSLVISRKGSTNLDKLTWQVSPRNKLIFQASVDPLRVSPLGINTLTDPLSGYTYRQGGPTYQIRWNAQPSSVMNVESFLATSHTGIALTPVTNGVKNTCLVDNLARDGLRLTPRGKPGGEPIDEDYCFETRTSRTSGSFFRDYADDRIRHTLRSDATYYLDNFVGISHTLKGGLIVEKERFTSLDTLRSFSTFAEQLVIPSLGESARTGGGVLSRTLFMPGLPDSERNKGDGTTYGFYLEDQFRPHQNVSLRFGVRVEQENIAAEGYKPFDPTLEQQRFDDAYDFCVRNGGRNCTRVSFKYFHVYEKDKFPTIGISPLRPYMYDPRLQLISREKESFRLSNTNIGPRFSVSWDPTGDQKTKIFATAGRIYDKTFLAIPIAEQGPDTFNFRYDVDVQPRCFPDPNGDGTVCQVTRLIQRDDTAYLSAPTVNQVDRNLRTPYLDEYTAGFSREIAAETSIQFTYIKRKFKDQFQDIDANHYARDWGNSDKGCKAWGLQMVPKNYFGTPVPDGKFDDCGGLLVTIPSQDPFGRATRIETKDGVPDLFIRDPFFNSIFRIGNFNQTNYTAYQLELNRRLHRNWELEASYVWSRAVGNAEDYASPLGDDPTTIQDEYGYLDYDQRHVVKVNVRTQIPVWNVRLGSTINWESGLPYSIVKRQLSLDGTRPFGDALPPQYSQVRTTFPTGQRNDQRNNGYWLLTASAKKDFTIGKTNLEASFEVFNILNTDTLYIAEVSNGRLIAYRTFGRQFQLQGKFSF